MPRVDGWGLGTKVAIPYSVSEVLNYPRLMKQVLFRRHIEQKGTTMNQSRHFPIQVFLISLIQCLLMFYGIANEAENDLEFRIKAINKEIRQQTNSFEMYEQNYLKLLENFNSLTDCGKIYMAIVRMYDRDISTYSTKVASYSQKALEYPLDLLEKVEMYSYLGQARMCIQRSEPTGAENTISERQIVIPFLKGLDVVFTNLTIENRQDPVPVMRLHLWGTLTNQDKELIKKRDEQIAKCKEIMMQNELLVYRDVFLQQIKMIYPDVSYDISQWKKIASEISNDPEQITNYFGRKKDGK